MIAQVKSGRKTEKNIIYISHIVLVSMLVMNVKDEDMQKLVDAKKLVDIVHVGTCPYKGDIFTATLYAHPADRPEIVVMFGYFE